VTRRAGRRVHRRLATAGLLAGLWFGLNAEPRRTGIAADRAAIYAVLLADLPHAAPIWQPIRFVEVTPAPATYVDMSHPPLPYDLSWVMGELAGAQPATVADFARRLEDHTSLRGLLPRTRVWPVGRSGDGGPAQPVAWFPIHAFSHVGFNPSRAQALVYVSYVCGGMCGDGHFVLLERSGGRWRIADSVMSWIS
jgi:hypothetical protein